MKLTPIIVVFVAAVLFVECRHMFMGRNFLRPLAYHKLAKFSPKSYLKRIEYVNVTLPVTILGILAYDLTHSGATANVTRGGLGYNFVNLRMKSDKGKKLAYDVYIYA